MTILNSAFPNPKLSPEGEEFVKKVYRDCGPAFRFGFIIGVFDANFQSVRKRYDVFVTRSTADERKFIIDNNMAAFMVKSAADLLALTPDTMLGFSSVPDGQSIYMTVVESNKYYFVGYTMAVHEG